MGLRILLGGDVMLGRGVDQILAHPSPDAIHEAGLALASDYVRLAERAHGPIPRRAGADYVWGDALRAWAAQSPDVRIVNLETAVTRSEAYERKGINYRMSPDHVGCLTAARIDACALANNHVLDWGRPGLEETLRTLEGAGVATAGAGRDEAEALEPAVVDRGGKGRVLLLACATGDSGVPSAWAARQGRPGVARIDLGLASAERIGRSLDAVRRPGDAAVVSIHWGGNWGYDVPKSHRAFAHALIDHAGVSVVFGHSAHHAMAAEMHRGRLALYGCGDLINDYEGIGGLEAFRPELVASYLVETARDGSVARFEVTPHRLERMRLASPSAEDRAWLLQRLAREYQPFGLALEERGAGPWPVRPNGGGR
ncbi:MAG TPA: CapA family protein [Caulobacteraceae bacterium]|nr:CapA family protein [Caulobacteraceae bacterium]